MDRRSGLFYLPMYGMGIRPYNGQLVCSHPRKGRSRWLKDVDIVSIRVQLVRPGIHEAYKQEGENNHQRDIPHQCHDIIEAAQSATKHPEYRPLFQSLPGYRTCSPRAFWTP